MSRPPATRRQLLVVAAGSAALLAGCGPGTENSTGTAAAPRHTPAPDVELLQFALTLEYLEAAFYGEVLRRDLAPDEETRRLIETLFDQEMDHAGALQSTIIRLRGEPRDWPAFRFDQALSGGPDQALSALARLEDTGARAYLGAITEIEDRAVLADALAIQAVEGRHAAAVGKAAGKEEQALAAGPVAEPLPRDRVQAMIQPYLASG